MLVYLFSLVSVIRLQALRSTDDGTPAANQVDLQESSGRVVSMNLLEQAMSQNDEKKTKAGIMSEGDFKDCSFEIDMFDNRNLDTKRAPKDLVKRISHGYWPLTAAINFAYAQQHGYGFRYTMDETTKKDGLKVTWRRWPYLAERVANLSKSEKPCSWIMYADSDAFVHEPDVPLPSFILDLAKRYDIRPDVGAILARERKFWDSGREEEGPLHTGAWANPGVILLNAKSPYAQRITNFMSNAPNAIDCCKDGWPTDMAALTERLVPNSYPRAGVSAASTERLERPGSNGASTNDTTEDSSSMSSDENAGASLVDMHNASSDPPYNGVTLVDMLEMNSPFGRFAAHVWGGWGRSLKADLYKDSLLRIDAWAPAKFTPLIQEIASKHVVSWRKRE